MNAPFYEAYVNDARLHVIVLWNEDHSCRLFTPEFPTIGFIEGKTREEAMERLAKQAQALVQADVKPAQWTLGTYAMITQA